MTTLSCGYDLTTTDQTAIGRIWNAFETDAASVAVCTAPLERAHRHVMVIGACGGYQRIKIHGTLSSVRSFLMRFDEDTQRGMFDIDRDSLPLEQHTTPLFSTRDVGDPDLVVLLLEPSTFGMANFKCLGGPVTLRRSGAQSGRPPLPKTLSLPHCAVFYETYMLHCPTMLQMSVSVCGARTLGSFNNKGKLVSSKEHIDTHTLKAGDTVDVYVDGERKFEAARIASVPYSRSGTLEPEKPIEVDMRTRFPLNARCELFSKTYQTGPSVCLPPSGVASRPRPLHEIKSNQIITLGKQFNVQR
jgi:hypothetical protein